MTAMIDHDPDAVGDEEERSVVVVVAAAAAAQRPRSARRRGSPKPDRRRPGRDAPPPRRRRGRRGGGGREGGFPLTQPPRFCGLAWRKGAGGVILSSSFFLLLPSSETENDDDDALTLPWCGSLHLTTSIRRRRGFRRHRETPDRPDESAPASRADRPRILSFLFFSFLFSSFLFFFFSLLLLRFFFFVRRESTDSPRPRYLDIVEHEAHSIPFHSIPSTRPDLPRYS